MLMRSAIHATPNAHRVVVCMPRRRAARVPPPVLGGPCDGAAAFVFGTREPLVTVSLRGGHRGEAPGSTDSEEPGRGAAAARRKSTCALGTGL